MAVGVVGYARSGPEDAEVVVGMIQVDVWHTTYHDPTMYLRTVARSTQYIEIPTGWITTRWVSVDELIREERERLTRRFRLQA